MASRMIAANEALGVFSLRHKTIFLRVQEAASETESQEQLTVIVQLQMARSVMLTLIILYQLLIALLYN